MRVKFYKWMHLRALKRLRATYKNAPEMPTARYSARVTRREEACEYWGYKWWALFPEQQGRDITGLGITSKEKNALAVRPGDYETLSTEKKASLDASLRVGEDKSRKAEAFYHAPRGGGPNSFMAFDGVIQVPNWMEEEDIEALYEAYENYKDKN